MRWCHRGSSSMAMLLASGMPDRARRLVTAVAVPHLGTRIRRARRCRAGRWLPSGAAEAAASGTTATPRAEARQRLPPGAVSRPRQLPTGVACRLTMPLHRRGKRSEGATGEPRAAAEDGRLRRATLLSTTVTTSPSAAAAASVEVCWCPSGLRQVAAAFRAGRQAQSRTHARSPRWHGRCGGGPRPHPRTAMVGVASPWETAWCPRRPRRPRLRTRAAVTKAAGAVPAAAGIPRLPRVGPLEAREAASHPMRSASG
mmetsp:Transcript_59221/g.127284  ORF Transcript_59221/g.127284 Transcript_59221/m.127284 type:complete len:257 (+) Transcript_59221:154-924(+)